MSVKQKELTNISEIHRLHSYWRMSRARGP